MPHKKKKRIDADTWLRDNLEYLVDNFAGGYVVIVDNEGLVFSDADGRPREIVEKAKTKYPGSIPLFFRVPRPQDFLCALLVR
jgi:hypothetical protein